MRDRLDPEVVQQAVAGNAAAVREVVQARQDAMLLLAYRVIGSADEAWEIVAEVFMRFIEAPERVLDRDPQLTVPLLHGVWALARRREVSLEEIPEGDRAVEAVVEAALQLPDRQRAELALRDGIGLDEAGVAGVLDIDTTAVAGEVRAARVALAQSLGIRGRDRVRVEEEARRVYRLWPALDLGDMAPEVVRDARRRGLVHGPSGLRESGGDAGALMIGNMRITPAMGLGILLVPLLIAAAIAMAVRGGGDGDDPLPVTSPTDTAPISVETFTGGVPNTAPRTNTAPTNTAPGTIETVRTGDTDGPSGGSSGGSSPSTPVDPGSGSGDSPSPATTAATPATTAASPTTTAASPPTTAAPVTRAPGSGAPPPPPATTSDGGSAGGDDDGDSGGGSSPAPATTSSGGAQPPPPEVPLP